MNHFEKQPKLEIRPIIEQKPFENPAVQQFFTKWCEINDSIQPEMIDRNEWEKRKKKGIKGVLEKRSDGKQTLFIPEDLRLWEMVEVMEAVDYDTFSAKPERRAIAKEKLLALGKTFQKAGTYIAKRLDGVNEGREMAKALALEFYEYGQSLVKGKKTKRPININDIASEKLTPTDTETIDHFLAGDELYESRQKKAEESIGTTPSKRNELYETERRKTLAQFFRVAERAFALKERGEHGELQKDKTQIKPWQSDTPIHSAFLKKVEKAMAQKIEIPKREFEMAIFRRGLEKLTSEMKEYGWERGINDFFEKLDLNLPIEQKRLVDALDMPKLKTDLELVRQLGDLEKISQKEREIANKIQGVVSSFPYKLNANNPAEMVANQYINCVGASILGGSLMKEAGLNYLVGDVPEHSILFLVTSDGKVEWRDMLSAFFNEKLTDEMIEGRKKDGAPLTAKDIVAFAQKPTHKGLMFDIKSDKYKKKLSWVKEGQRQYVTVFGPEYGQQIQVLNNTGNVLRNLGRNEEAIEAYRQAVAVDPKYAHPYNGLGNALYDLGRNEEAIEAYQRFIDLSDNGEDGHFVERAKQIIAGLKNKKPPLKEAA